MTRLFKDCTWWAPASPILKYVVTGYHKSGRVEAVVRFEYPTDNSFNTKAIVIYIGCPFLRYFYS